MFKELFSEMAILNGLGHSGSSRKGEWKNRNNKFVTLIHDKLPGRTRFYKYGSSYYLTDTKDEYIGFIEIHNNIISKAHCIPKKLHIGFYQFMLPLIISEIGTIFSDDSLSSSAVEAYKSLSTGLLNISLSDGSPFSVDKLFSNRKLRVVIKESIGFEISEGLISYYKKINQKTDLGSHFRDGDWMIMYNENNDELFSLLFGMDILV